jgi:hypothetical protein
MSSPEPRPDPSARRRDRVAAAVEWLQRHAVLVFGLAFALTVACGFHVARTFTITTDFDSLLSPNLPFQRDSAAFARAFPQLQNALVVVVDGPTPALAREGAGRLAERLG